MPPFPGEERLVTVFADIHYYFAQPTVRPALYRFDKASYFYIYYNSTRHTSRIEIANHPGTPDQDAFNGYIDTCRITNSARFPTLLTIDIDAVPTSPTSPKTGRDPEEWCLASGDSRDSTRSKHRLHTLDVYFWAAEDAKLVLECFKRLLPANQLDVPDLEPETQAQHARSHAQPANVATSPVVQNLENMAVTDTYNEHVTVASATSPSSSFAGHNLLPPPPAGHGQMYSPSPAVSDLSQTGRQASMRSATQSADFQPMAYNPAAPAAPEPIAHREKTPPPEDGTEGHGLTQAVRPDQSYQPGSMQGRYQSGRGPAVAFGGGYASPPPQHPGGYASPPPQQPGIAGYTATPPPPGPTANYGSIPQSTYSRYPDQRSSAISTTPSFGPGAGAAFQQGSHHSTAAENYIPHHNPQQPVMTPGSQFYDNLQQPVKPLAHVQPQYADYLSAGGTHPQHVSANATPQPPMGGYSQYDYRQQGQQQHQVPSDVHQQVYRPTEHEAGTRHHSKPSRSSTSGGDSRKESRADKVEKGVGRLFKKIEKKIG